ncbi:radical SAM family heme chaperone HemW [Croceicoccus naphthovorans]|uniref:Heme chaperone HemW n=1 Tax=Croceicoccus naphthovorans TaxID=1348774 RepID=A0A0G3XH87_9SPHN|nr:radical SAM family heme chaperone HemW [Croceicoccus naphthovorans]AKM10006.1 coproporphyrinogen III oxidase [Croceicoccus naphthovorans]MBB3991115.1 oxygen-independent coproporphyrinogen-3 oxidase [Croceicoccus naphthovorans]
MSLALYIHWPFCLKKCPYCDFNSHVRDGVDVDAWQRALLADMAFEAEATGRRELGSIFFGGGTPSLMPPALVAGLIEQAARHWDFAPDIEITLEANPSSVEAARFADLATAGVNRTSLGLQSLDDNALKFLGRLHDASEGIAALDVAQKHFGRVSIDLIYARPGQSESEWQDELRRALAFGTGHISLYQLTIEPGTRFATDFRKGAFELPEDDLASTLFTMTGDMTRAAGLPLYEISNHARPGEESRHNLTYWRYGDYAGIGPGAHGRRCGTATQRHRKPENYLSAVTEHGHGMVEQRPLPRAEQAAEALMMGLRLAEGVDPAALARRFAITVPELVDADRIGLYERLGFVTRHDGRVAVTDKGMIVLDSLIADIVSPSLMDAP